MHFDTPHNPLNNSGVVGPHRSRRAGGPGARTGLPGAVGRSVAVLAILLWALAARGEHYALPLLVTPGTSGDPQGMLRILNGTAESGTVEVYAIDDAGTRTGPATFTLNASAAAEFTATDLQSGNATLGLSGGIGTDVGDARLLIDTDLEIVPLALVRAADGTLSAMHDTVRAASTDGSGRYAYEVPVFNPSTEMSQVSRLRLINPGDTPAAVTIGARDDSGAEATAGDVTLTLPPGGAKTLTAQQLEAGDSSITGLLGAGTGKWRLRVSSDRPLQMVNIVASAAGYWNNLSTTAAAGAPPASPDPDGMSPASPDPDDESPVSPGDCYAGLLVGIGETCTYPGTTDEFSVNVRGRGSFLGRLAGIRIRIDNETVNGRVYDFSASHQGDGVWRIDRVAGRT